MVTTEINNWIQNYYKLIAFVNDHPDILIDKNITCFPLEYKQTFYEIFDEVRASFLMQNFPEHLSEANRLTKAFNDLEYEIKSSLHLKSILLSLRLRRYVSNPKAILVDCLRDTLLALLKGNIDINTFIEQSKYAIEKVSNECYWPLYQKYIVLALIKEFDATSILLVDIPKPSLYIKQEEISWGLKAGCLPTPNEAPSCLNLCHDLEDVLVVPDCIIYSRLIHKYVAIRCGLKEARWESSDITPNEQWLSHSEITKNGYGKAWYNLPLIAVYSAVTSRDVSIVGDRKRICRPDLILYPQWNYKPSNFADIFSRINMCNSVLNPSFGSYLIYRSIPRALICHSDGIPAIKIDLDTSQLKTISAKLS